MTTVNTAYSAGLHALGAKKIVSINNGHTGPGEVGERRDGIYVLGNRPMGDGSFVGSTRVPTAEVLTAVRELMAEHPDADTIWIGWPHRASVDCIETLEQEFGVGVVSASQSSYGTASGHAASRTPYRATVASCACSTAESLPEIAGTGQGGPLCRWRTMLA